MILIIKESKVYGEIPKGFRLCMNCFEYYHNGVGDCPICQGLPTDQYSHKAKQVVVGKHLNGTDEQRRKWLALSYPDTETVIGGVTFPKKTSRSIIRGMKDIYNLLDQFTDIKPLMWKYMQFLFKKRLEKVIANCKFGSDEWCIEMNRIRGAIYNRKRSLRRSYEMWENPGAAKPFNDGFNFFINSTTKIKNKYLLPKHSEIDFREAMKNFDNDPFRTYYEFYHGIDLD